jgi:hypothetical protein
VLWTLSTLVQVLGVIKVLQWIGSQTIQAITKNDMHYLEFIVWSNLLSYTTHITCKTTWETLCNTMRINKQHNSIQKQNTKEQKNPWCKKKHKIKNNNNVKTTQENKKTIAIMLQWKKLEASSEQS